MLRSPAAACTRVRAGRPPEVSMATALSADMVGYAAAATEADARGGAGAVAAIDAAIRRLFVDACASVGIDPARSIVHQAGDGAMLLLDDAPHADRLATAIHHAAHAANQRR